MNISIVFWHSKLDNIEYNGDEFFKFTNSIASKRCLIDIIEKIDIAGYNSMIVRSGNQKIVFIDNKRFGKR